MIVRFILIIASCALILSSEGSALAQTNNFASRIDVSDRERDGLTGPVRRVTVESAKITFKEATPSEGPRVLREVTTYDVRGKKIDSMAYPAEGGAVPGKERYKYDDKGNIIEMELVGADGSILSREHYKYVFDELGNWKQMTTSLAVFEDGKLSEEPVEVTYRNISYFYTQEIAKITDSSKNPNKARTNAATKPAPVKNKQSTSEAAPTPATNPEVKIQPANETSKSVPTADTATAERSVAPAAPSAPVVRRVSEDLLRKAALSLPQPVYPELARVSRMQGRVPVELMIDEQGTVTRARATSTNPLLNEAAETAARSARFAPATLSGERSQLIGTINYDFVLPTSSPTAESTAKTTPEKNSDSANATNVALNSTITPVPVQPVASADQAATNYYKTGVAYLEAGQNAEAAQALNQAVYKDPEFAAAYVKLGLAYCAMQKHKEAVAVFKMASKIQKDVMDAEAYYQLGLAYTSLAKHSEALNAFKQALYVTRAESIDSNAPKSGIVPTPEELHYSLGLAYHNLGRFDDGIKELNQVVAANPRLAQAYYGLALCYLGKGDRRAAEKQRQILAPMNSELADKVSRAFATNNIAPPGVSEGILGGRRRQ